MKTNVVMQSNDRKLFGHVIRQETKTSFLNLTDLTNLFDSMRMEKGWTNKHLPELMSRRENVDRFYYILNKLNVSQVDRTTFIEQVEKHGITKTLKAYGQYKTTGARHTKTTWCNPYIWTLIALELSPEFYANAVIWLTDQLIINRIEAGNFYKELSYSIKKFPNPDYITVAKALNYIVFNRHEAGIRNSASQKELKEMEDIESKMAFAINMGYIKTQDELITELRKMYNMKFGKQI